MISALNHLARVVAFASFLAPCLFSESRTIHITRQYLNIPISNNAKMQVLQINLEGVVRREIPAQLASDSVDYWVYIDVSEFNNQTITLSGPATDAGLNRIYQDSQINGASSLYQEANRPQFHFTVKRGWNNDVNGPLFYHGQYHLFWQAFPFGVTWDTGFMYWGHAVSKDLVHWRELSPALMLDNLGSPWSGSSFIDHNNDGGWGKDALVLVYTAFDRVSHKQVQCIAYSTDNGVTFTHFERNPVLDTNSELGSNDTRDPKVFWYAPAHHWVMVLFEKDGMSFFSSTSLKDWTRTSHIKGLHECPDFFELPVDGDATHKKWILHGGSSKYFIGSFDGKTFTPESPELDYAEGKNSHGDDVLYAAQSFANMPDGRRVQMAWGRIKEDGMPFNQMMLFPTEFKLTATSEGLRMRATPIGEIEQLHVEAHAWSSLTAAAANQNLHLIKPGPLHVKLQLSLHDNDELSIQYQGTALTTLKAGSVSVELLIDKCVAEIFVNGGERYLLRQLPPSADPRGLEFFPAAANSGISRLEVYEIKSMWNTSPPKLSRAVKKDLPTY